MTPEEELLSATFQELLQIPDWLKRHCRRAIDDVLLSLTTREERVIRLRFGFEGRWHTLREVGREFYLTRERIRQIENKALRKLRHPFRARQLLTPLILERQLEAEEAKVLEEFVALFDRASDVGRP